MNNKIILSEKQFYEYFKKPLSKKEIKDIFNQEDIIIEKCELYIDFFETFINNIHTTYLGSDDINTDEKIEGHLKWCFNKTCQEFHQYNFNFQFDEQLFEYLKDFFSVVWYNIPDNDKIDAINGIITHWRHVFNFNGIKTSSDMDDLIMLYWFFNYGLNQELRQKMLDKTRKKESSLLKEKSKF